tara:strand:- start:1159 stop:1758 length:600 start_codon:yes stop_codon:yes gene_type:complete
MDWNDPEQVRAYHRAYYLKNKEKILECNKEWYYKNTEKKKKYRQKNKEKMQAYEKEYYQKNIEKIKERKKQYWKKNKEKIQKIKTEWRKNNSALVLQHMATRRARKIRAIPALLRKFPVEKRRVYTVYLLSRIYAKADGIERHVDHMVPLSDGGPHWSGNLQILTKEQNLEKGAYSCPKLKKQIKLNLKEARALHVKAA